MKKIITVILLVRYCTLIAQTENFYPADTSTIQRSTSTTVYIAGSDTTLLNTADSEKPTSDEIQTIDKPKSDSSGKKAGVVFCLMATGFAVTLCSLIMMRNAVRSINQELDSAFGN